MATRSSPDPGPEQALPALYGPYCGGVDREGLLAEALERLAVGQVQGQRRLWPDGRRAFLLRWRAGGAPQELSRCDLSVSAASGGASEVTYGFEVPTHQLVRWLMDLLEAAGRAPEGSGSSDLPDTFWRWLLQGEGSPSA